MSIQFNSINEFLAMGGYGFYVWLSYGITFLACSLLIWQSKREIKQTLKLAKKERMRDAQMKR